MSEAGSTKAFELVFEGVGRTSGKMRNDISVSFTTMNETFELATDEGSIHGGDGTAPPPLALFTAALTGCLMTQIRAFAKRMKIKVEAAEVSARLHWRAEQIDNEPYVSEPVGFALDVQIEADCSVEQRVALLNAARKGCFIEQSLTLGTTITHRLKTEDGWLDCP
ncbi:MAG: OsmC-related (seleno)protein [Burkholderiaceae bacterium]